MPRRTIIVGMNNPISHNPRHALWPDPPNCTGWRLWKLLEARTGATQADYVRAFERTNLVVGDWSMSVGVQGWAKMERQLVDEFDTIVLLGAAVRRAAGLSHLPALSISPSIATIPHPSGLNCWFNVPLNRALAELTLEELYVRAVT